MKKAWALVLLMSMMLAPLSTGEEVQLLLETVVQGEGQGFAVVESEQGSLVFDQEKMTYYDASVEVNPSGMSYKSSINGSLNLTQKMEETFKKNLNGIQGMAPKPIGTGIVKRTF